MIDHQQIKLVIFDLDGVITDSASVHFRAWKWVFDKILSQAGLNDCLFSHQDYLIYVDGKSRKDGIYSFLNSRQIDISQVKSNPDFELNSLEAIGNAKDKYFLNILAEEGVKTFEDANYILEWFLGLNIKLAVASSSRNCSYLLKQAKLYDYFSIHMDGAILQQMQQKSKPDPFIFSECVRLAQVHPAESMVIEDATAGVMAAKRADIGFIYGLDRTRHQSVELLKAGAHQVIDSLNEIKINWMNFKFTSAN